jgi:DNA-binding NtrC family response regulator
MSKKPVILVVGNDLDQREAVVRALDPERHRVIEVHDFQEALLYLDQDIDLVISQLHSREMRGLELLRTWKSRQPRSKFVLVTGDGDVSSAVEAMKLGASDCLVQPIDTQVFRQLVTSILDARDPRDGGAFRNSGEPAEEGRPAIDIPPGTSLEDLERAAVEQALAQHHGNRTHAAKTLGISVRTLQRKLKAWGMPLGAAQNQPPAPHFFLTPHTPQASHSSLTTNAH